MADNFFDQFDEAAPVAPPAPRAYKMVPRAVAPRSTPAPAQNFFDQFDQADTPINRALAQQAEADIDFQAQAQERYQQQQDFAKQLTKQYPQLSGPSSMQEPAPDLDPYLSHRLAPIADREQNPSKAMGSGFAATAKSALVDDPDTKRRIIAQNLFPNDPDGIYRVGFDAKGDPVYVGDDNKLHKIASGTAAFGANMLVNSPEMVMATVGSLAGPAGAALGAGGAHGIKRGIAGLYYDEPQTIGHNLAGMATEAGTALAGEAIGRGMVGFGNAGRRIDFAPADMAKAEDLIKRVKAATNVDLDLAQASGDRRLIALRAYLARYPGPSANMFQDAEKLSKGQFHEAVQNTLDTIASATPAEVAGQNGINAAELAITTARKTAEARVDPLYQAAYAKAPIVVDPNVIRFFRHPEFREAYRKGQDIARLLEKENPTVTVRTTRTVPGEPPPMTATEVPQMSAYEVPGSGRAAREPAGPGLTAEQARLGYSPEPKPPGTSLVPADTVGRDIAVIDENGNIVSKPRKFKRERTPSGVYRTTEVVDETHMPVPDLRALDYTKRGLDRMIESLMASGHKDEARALAQQRNAFRDALDNLDVPEYQAARAAWKKELAENIRPLENSPVGVLARIRDPQANKAAARLFSDPNLTDTMIATTRKAIEKVAPEAWPDLARTWIAHNWNKAQRVTRTSTEVNSPGAFHQMLFGTPEATKNTIAMLDKPSAETLKGVMEAAEALKQTPTAGSNTFRDQETKEIFEGLTGQSFKIWDAITSPRQALRTAAQRRAAEQSTLAVAEGILNPAKRSQLRVILRMRPSTRRNILLFNVMGAETAKDFAQSRAAQGENSHLIAGEDDAVGQ